MQDVMPPNMQRRALLGLSLAAIATPALVAPAWAQSGDDLAPPTPRDVRIHIRASENGGTVRVPVDSRFAVELVGTPTAGMLWQPFQMPMFLTRAGDVSGPTTRAQRQPGFAGGNHWEVYMFSALEPGSGELVLAQVRPWEPNEAYDVFRVTIIAE